MIMNQRKVYNHNESEKSLQTGLQELSGRNLYFNLYMNISVGIEHKMHFTHFDSHTC